VEFKAPEGKQGIPGNNGVDGKDGNNGHDGKDGVNGKDGRNGHDGTGLTLKTFVKDQTYNKGDYVFAPSSKDPKHDSMYIAAKAFTALKSPSEELDKNHWVEFKAPEGKQGVAGKDGVNGHDGRDGANGANGRDGVNGHVGPKGDPGVQGEKGEKGNDGVGLKFVTFKLHDTYVRGNYVFSRSSNSSTVDSMFIAKKDSIVADKLPFEDLDNWAEYHAPRGEKGEKGPQGIAGAPGSKGDKGNDGPTGPMGGRGEKGNDGTGLIYKDFKLGQIYNRGDYVIQPSTKKASESSLFIAQTTFNATILPRLNVGNNTWIEFAAPRGEMGPAGPKGNTGTTGPSGVAGKTGTRGIQGLQGIQGITGPSGLRGIPGPASTVPGPRGITGLRGATGATGDRGLRGFQGIHAN